MSYMRFDIKVGKSHVNTPKPQIAEVISAINHRIHRPQYAVGILGVGSGLALIAVCFSYVWLGLFIFTVCSLGAGGWHYYQQRDRSVTLNYVCDHDIQLRFVTIQQACQALSKSEKVWIEAARKPVKDKHQNAGASQVISLSKAPVKISCMPPPFIQTNVTVWALQIGQLSLFFLPDYILLWRRRVYSAISYSSVKISCDRQQINIAGNLPSDARILGQTWQNVSADGTPASGARGNQKLFRVQYGLLRVMATIGVNLKLYVSSVDNAEQFTKSFCSVQQWLSPRSKASPATPKMSLDSPYNFNPNRPAHEVLGVKPNASLTDIRAAYHRVARMNHPDKLTGLAPEFRQLAEHRMKVITAAYKTLRQQSSYEGSRRHRR